MIKVIFDTDIGDDIDDAFALYTLLKDKDVDLLGVTTVFRNSLDRAKMARRIIELYGADIKCYAGEDNPLKQDIDSLNPEYVKNKETINGEGKYVLPQWKDEFYSMKVEDESATDFIINTIHKYPNEVVILATGPFTNIASAIKKDPSICSLVKEARIMGGRVYPSNPVEWNVKCDPEAAAIMYDEIPNLYCVGINITESCILSEQFINQLKINEDKTIKLIVSAMEQWFKHYERNDPTMHDPIAAVSLTNDIITFNKENVSVSLKDESRGLTLISEGAKNRVYVASKIDKEKFFKIFNKIINNN